MTDSHFQLPACARRHRLPCIFVHEAMQSARLDRAFSLPICGCSAELVRPATRGEREGGVHGFRKTTAHTSSRPQHVEPCSQRAEGEVGSPESRKQFSNPRNANGVRFERTNFLVAAQRSKAIRMESPPLRRRARHSNCDFRENIAAFCTEFRSVPAACPAPLPDSPLTICHKAGPPFRRDRS